MMPARARDALLVAAVLAGAAMGTLGTMLLLAPVLAVICRAAGGDACQ